MHAQNMSRSKPKPKKSLVTIQRGQIKIPGFSLTVQFIHYPGPEVFLDFSLLEIREPRSDEHDSCSPLRGSLIDLSSQAVKKNQK